MRSIFKTFLQGLVVSVPVLLTGYVCIKTVLWLDITMRAGFQQIGLPAMPGVGVLTALVGIYLVGLTARTWIMQSLIHFAEHIVDRIPLVKSLYSAVKDLLQFLSGTDTHTRGIPVKVHLKEGQIQMLGLITQRNPGQFMGQENQDRIAVFLPMSYQIGGYTIYVKPDQVEQMPQLTVEDIMKLSMTAGIGSKDQFKVTGGSQSSSPENTSANSSEESTGN